MNWKQYVLNGLINFVLGALTIGALLGLVTWMNLGAHWPWYVQMIAMAIILATVGILVAGPTLWLEILGVRKPKA